MARFLFPFDTRKKPKPAKSKVAKPKGQAPQAHLAVARHRGEQLVTKMRHAFRGLN